MSGLLWMALPVCPVRPIRLYLKVLWHIFRNLAYIPEAGRLAVAHHYEPLVSIYSMDGTLLSNTWGPDGFMQEFSVNENNATQYGDFVMYGSMVGWEEDVRSLYSTLRSHEGRLYALFTGERMSAAPEDAAVEEPAAGSRIIVLDSDGVPLEEGQ